MKTDIEEFVDSYCDFLEDMDDFVRLKFTLPEDYILDDVGPHPNEGFLRVVITKVDDDLNTLEKYIADVVAKEFEDFVQGREAFEKLTVGNLRAFDTPFIDYTAPDRENHPDDDVLNADFLE